MPWNRGSSAVPERMIRHLAPRACAGLLVALGPMLLAGCDPATQAPQRSSFQAFDTTVDITLHGVSAHQAALLSGRLRQQFEDWERRWSPWSGDGIASVNRALAEGEPAEVSPELAKLLARARAMTLASDGRFDPGIGALNRLWGFHADIAASARVPPPPQALAQWRQAAPSLAQLQIAGTTVSAPEGQTALQIDLGAFARGMALERAMNLLRASDVPAAMINIGGDIAVMGSPGGRSWRIGLRAPGGEQVLAVIALRSGETAFTIGDYERYFTDGGRRFHHILNPQTGRPAGTSRLVTVIHSSAARAGAAATALFVAGPGRWRDTARALAVDRVLLVGTDGRLHVSSPMLERVDLVGDPAPPIVVASEGE
jgi:thiamine biosynthesis lipoprotein